MYCFWFGTDPNNGLLQTNSFLLVASTDSSAQKASSNIHEQIKKHYSAYLRFLK